MSRRELLAAVAGAMRAGGAVSGAALAGPALAGPATARAADADPRIVQDLIAREQAAGFAHPASTGFALHERDHARALRAHLAAFGRPAPRPPRTASELDPAARRLAEAGDLDAAIALEASLLATYTRALAALVNPALLQTAATIMAAHAQHHAILRRRAGLDPLS